jgi:hypothetical protein
MLAVKAGVMLGVGVNVEVPFAVDVKVVVMLGVNVKVPVGMYANVGLAAWVGTKIGNEIVEVEMISVGVGMEAALYTAPTIPKFIILTTARTVPAMRRVVNRKQIFFFSNMDIIPTHQI